MIFAAGLGTRLRPLTDNCPKALVPVAGKPLLEHLILRLKAAGFDHLVINVHHFGEQIIDFLEEKAYFGLKIDISDERDLLCDTGGGIKKAARFLDDGTPFLVHNVDIFSDLDLNRFYHSHKATDLATLLVGDRKTSRYLLFDGQNRLVGWKNVKTGQVKPGNVVFDPEQYKAYAFGGIHVMSSEVLALMADWPDCFSIVDFYLQQAAVWGIKGWCPAGELKWLDVGKPETLVEAEKFIRRND